MKSAAKQKRKKERNQTDKQSKDKKKFHLGRGLALHRRVRSRLESSESSMSSSSPASKRQNMRGASASTWSPVKPQMIIVDGKEHFRGTSNNLIDCSKPPHMKCKYSKAHHWFWQRQAFGCFGPRKKMTTSKVKAP